MGSGDQPKPEVKAQPADTRAADEAAIRAASAAWSQAASAKDIDKAVGVYADDALVLPQRSPATRDKDAIRKGWEGVFAQPGRGLSWDAGTIEVAHSGDLAYETGSYNFVTADKRGKTTTEKGKYLVIWKKQSDGIWKVAVDTDNSDQ